MDERDWNDAPFGVDETIDLGKVKLTRKTMEHVLLVSGNIDNALETLAPRAKVAGLGDKITADDYVIRLGRETILLHTMKPVMANSGWSEDGYAISHADGKYAMIEISGAGAETLLAQGTSIRFLSHSPSAMVQFAGQNCILVRKSDSWLLFVEQPMLTYLCGFLSGANLEI